MASVTEAIDALIEFGRAAARERLLVSTCGNASIRVNEDTIAISASGSELRALSPEDVSIVKLIDSEHLEGPAPSMELGFHAGVYKARRSIGAVLHCQSPAATVWACHPDPPTDINFIPEIPAYVRKHVYVPYTSPGSSKLAEYVTEAFGDPDVTVVQMVNHGQTIAGANWAKVVRRAAFFELACWMALQREGLVTIPASDVEILRGYSRDI